MSQVEWNKKEELVAEQALKHLKQYTPLFEAFTTTARSELALMLKIQEFCYGNMNFMKVFQKIILLFYKSELFNAAASAAKIICIICQPILSLFIWSNFFKFMVHCTVTNFMVHCTVTNFMVHCTVTVILWCTLQ
jgi:hypothetical protein